MFLGCRPWSKGTDQLGRETFLMPVKWSADSFPYIVQCIDTVPSVLNRPGTVQRPVETGNIRVVDHFDSKRLAPSWLTLWGPADRHIELTGKGLKLQCAPVDSKSGKTPAYIGRRVKNHEYEVTATVTLDKGATGNDAAGILVVKGEKRQIFFAVTPTAVKVMKPSGEVVAESKVRDLDKPVRLRMECKDGAFSFAYAIPANSTNWHVMDGTVDATFVSSSQSGFTGTTVGLFATSKPF